MVPRMRTSWEMTMADVCSFDRSGTAASFVLGCKLDSIPFSAYHLWIIAVLALVGVVEGYDLSMTGLLLVLAKGPLHLTGAEIRWLVVGPTFMVCVGDRKSTRLNSSHLGISY